MRRRGSRGDTVGGELLRQPAVERVQRLVRDAAAQHRVGLGVDRLRGDHALEEPRRRAVDEPLELGGREGGAPAELGEHDRVAELRLALERGACAVEPPRPVVRLGECERALLAVAVGREPRERTHARARWAQRRAARSAGRAAGGSLPGRRLPHRTQRRRRARTGSPRARAFVVRRLADEVEPRRRARARRVEEVPVAADRSGRSSRAPSSRRRSSSRNGEPRSRRGSEPSSSPSTNTTSKRRVRARRKIEHRDPARSGCGARTSVRSSAATRSSTPSASPSLCQRPSSSRSAVAAPRHCRSSREVSPAGGASSP